MTAFAASDIPASITTLEQLHAWSGTVLNNMYPALTSVEATNTAERVAQASPFYITAASPATWRYIVRGSLALNADWQKTGKIWEHAQSLGSDPIPTAFKS